ncbi:MAG: hypothetical protein IJS28_10605 [Synergistaceae bacterium]|nr:hypothetical protein [Synergistaceae bacterium]
MEQLTLKMERFSATKIFYLCVFLISVLVMFQRKPHVLVYANFWAEDGKIFFEQMYHEGLKSLLYPYAGYLHLVPRLVMFITLPFGIINAPLISNFMSLVLRALPMVFLFTERFSFMGMACRFFLWIYCLIMPQALEETIGNITNIQWNLSVWLLMVIIAAPAKTTMQKLHDWLVLILAGLSGPFIIFAFPLMIAGKPSRGKSIAFRMFAVLLGLIQLYTVLNTAQEVQNLSFYGTGRTAWEFIVWLIRIFCTRVVYSTFLPNFPSIMAYVLDKSMILTFIVFAPLACITARGFFRGTWRFRVCALFGSAIFLSSSWRMWLSVDVPYGITVGGGSRYFVLANILVFSFMIFFVRDFWLSGHEQLKEKCCTYITILLFVMALVSFSLFPPFKLAPYRQSIRELYYPAPAGSTVVIPINPDGWEMTLIKKEK